MAEEPKQDQQSQEPEAGKPEAEAPAAEAPAAAPQPPSEEEQLSPKERRKRERSRARGPRKPSRSPAELAAERAQGRKARAAVRRRRRAAERARKREPRAGTPPADRRPGVRKERQGKVVSAKPDKSITVQIEIARRHPVYEKVVRRTATVHAHDEGNDANEGDVVKVVEARPLSKTKRWRLVEVVERAR